LTQSFNTSSSMGRLTLNVLLSFAQFERELVGERVRDKIAASKRKGIWVGGPVPLGYAAVDKQILVVETDAAAVRTIFARYLELGSIRALAEELDRRGIRSKPRRLSFSATSMAMFVPLRKARTVCGCQPVRNRVSYYCSILRLCGWRLNRGQQTLNYPITT
jgi:hypothetical protein